MHAERCSELSRIEARLEAERIRVMAGTEGPVTCERLAECCCDTYAEVPISKLRGELSEVLQKAREVETMVAERVGKVKQLFLSWTGGEEVFG